MRHLVSLLTVLAVCFVLGAPQARATPLLSTPLHVDIDVVMDAAILIDAIVEQSPQLALPALPVIDLLATTTQQPRIPAHYAWVERDTRAFWYAVGAGAVTNILAGIPMLAISISVLSAVISTGGFAAAVAVSAGIFVAFAAGEAALASVIGMLVFDSMSDTYESHFLSGFLAHIAGTVAATAVTTVTFGGGLLLFHGMGLLGEFTGGAGISSIQIFSFLGAMPAFVICGTALVAIPAIAAAWGLAAGATAKPGYAIDNEWQSPTIVGALRGQRDSRVTDPGRRRGMGAVDVAMPLTFALPVP